MKRFICLAMIGWALADASAQQGTLLISELLFQPRSGEAEYVELYNNSDDSINLGQYSIVRVLHDELSTHYPLPAHTVAPHDYVVLTKDAGSVSSCFHVEYPLRLVECDLPTYPNNGGSVVLGTTDSQLVDRLDYSPSMHSRLLRDKAGVSLERRSFDRPTNDADNWFSASSTSGYGTPTAPNSQSVELLATESSFLFSSDIVSPDGDDYQDFLEITYQLDSKDISAHAEVYDIRGKRVRRLLNGDLMGAAGTIRWDGMAEGGIHLPTGQYIVLITLYDPSGLHQRLRHAVAVVRQ